VLRKQVTTGGHELINEYVDDGHSGARLDRPGLDALRDAAEAGLFEAVWCLSPDRLARAYAYRYWCSTSWLASASRCTSATLPTWPPTTRKPCCSPKCRA